MFHGLPEAITLQAVSIAGFYAALLACIFGCVVTLIEWKIHGDGSRFLQSTSRLVSASIPISVIGFLAGYLTATSRSGAVGNVLPAILGLIGGANIYVFGKDSTHKVLVSFCACMLAIMLFYGTQYGAYRRELGREFRIMEAMKQELRIQTLRKNLGLPDQIPGWVVGVEPK